MLTFEKVLEIFEDYLAQDMELEVYKSRYGYVCVSFNGSPPRTRPIARAMCAGPRRNCSTICWSSTNPLPPFS